MIADLLNIPQSPEDFFSFSFANAAHHTDVVVAIRAKGGATIAPVPLDPIPPTDFQTWLSTHQQHHILIDAALGVQGNDLLDLDLKDQKQVQTWFALHANEHFQWANILGVS